MYYFEVITKNRADFDTMFNRFHGLLRRDKLNTVGLSFPDYTPLHYGSRVYVVSRDEILLKNITNNECFRRCYVGAVEIVPADAEYCTFKRNRRLEALSDKGLMRRTSYCKRIARIKQADMKEVRRSSAEFIVKGMSEYTEHNRGFILVESSNKKRFSIIIDKVEAEPELSFSSYGLKGQVPMF